VKLPIEIHCPVCTPPQVLAAATVAGSLAVHGCGRCGGRWVRNADYLAWMLAAAALPRSLARAEPPAAVTRPAGAADTEPRLRYCPDCRHVLARFHVGQGVDFLVDHCRNCAGTWLDATEWEVLRERGLHDDLLHVFTDEWQQSVRDEARRARLDAEFRARVGEDDYARLLEVKGWLDAHPRRPELLAFLQARPLSPPRAPA
jgi:Zn-finger nucleic acid-binding protein